MKGFTENLCAAAQSVKSAAAHSLNGKAAILSISMSLAACGGGGGGGSEGAAEHDAGATNPTAPSNPSVETSNNNNAPAPVVSYDEHFVLTATLPDGVSGDGENLFLDDTDAGRGDDNDSPFSAFGLPSNATVLGAVTQSESDQRDFFLVDLDAGQWLTLEATEPTAANADVFLYDSNMVLQTAGMGPAALEAVRVPRSGTYYIEVAHALGLSNALVKYRLELLTAGQMPGAHLLSAASYSIAEHIIPGQLIVNVIDHAGVITPETVKLDLDDAGLLAPKFSHKSALQGSRGLLHKLDRSVIERRSAISNKTTRQVFDTLLQARMLEGLAEVVSAEPDQLLYSNGLSTVNDNDGAKQWGAEMIDVEAAWPVTTGEGVAVAVLDSAFLPDHPDLAGRMRQGYDFVDDDADVQASTSLSLHHGTHVAGIIAAARNNNAYIAGVAPDVEVMPLRVMADCLCGSMGDILQALRYAAGLPNASGLVPAKKAAVANLSLQFPYGGSTALVQTIEAVTEAGTTVVWAAGNEADRHSYDEAGITGVPGLVVVAAVGSFQQLSSYSNYGSAIDLAAPGGDLDAHNGAKTITSLNGDYSNGEWVYSTTRMQGTSQAAPFVSAVIALMASVWDDLTPALVDSMIEAGALSRDIGLAGNDDYYGAGLLDASLAVQAALQQVGSSDVALTPKRIVAAPSDLHFGSALDQIEMDIFSTDDAASALQLSYAPSWVTVQQQQTEQGYGIWRVTVNRNALGDQNTEDLLRFSNGDRQLVVPISAHNPEQTGRSTGVAKLLVQFHSSANQQLLYQAYALPVAGHQFVLASNSVPAGDYSVRLSSDFDGDYQYCESGELCGQLASVTVLAAQPVRLNVALQMY